MDCPITKASIGSIGRLEKSKEFIDRSVPVMASAFNPCKVWALATMELCQIRYFLAVADTLNLTRASERSFVSQPALAKGHPASAK